MENRALLLGNRALFEWNSPQQGTILIIDMHRVYWVATVSRIDKIIYLFCRILSLLYGSFAKEIYNFIDPTDRSHPIVLCCGDGK